MPAAHQGYTAIKKLEYLRFLGQEFKAAGDLTNIIPVLPVNGNYLNEYKSSKCL
jgi:hypothetical protein